MSKHTDTSKYLLRVGLAGSVVCDDPGLGVPDADADAYYGGRVFCETITQSNAELVVKSLNALSGIADPAAFVEAANEVIDASIACFGCSDARLSRAISALANAAKVKP